jgi:hypothetical protein
MGMYTEIYINADLKENTPKEVIQILLAICNGHMGDEVLKNKPSRWRCLFANASYYTPLTSCGQLSYSDIGGHYSILGKGDIKNYEDEIQEFFEWIKPYCQNDYEESFIGYYRYEESREPTLIYTDNIDTEICINIETIENNTLLPNGQKRLTK